MKKTFSINIKFTKDWDGKPRKRRWYYVLISRPFYHNKGVTLLTIDTDGIRIARFHF